MELQKASEFFEKLLRGEDYCLLLNELEELVEYELGVRQKGLGYDNLKERYDSHIRNENCEDCKAYYKAIKSKIIENI